MAGWIALCACAGSNPGVHLFTDQLVSSVVVAHPSRFTKDNTDLAAGPMLFLCAETDEAFPPTFFSTGSGR